MREVEEIEIKGKAVELTVNSKEEFVLRYLTEIRTLEQGHIKTAPNCYIGIVKIVVYSMS